MIKGRIATVHEACLTSLQLFKPLIAAINGPCVAAVMELVGAIDSRIAGTGARFGILEPKRGLIAGTGTTVRLPCQLTFPAAMELLLSTSSTPSGRSPSAS